MTKNTALVAVLLAAIPAGCGGPETAPDYGAGPPWLAARSSDVGRAAANQPTAHFTSTLMGSAQRPPLSMGWSAGQLPSRPEEVLPDG